MTELKILYQDERIIAIDKPEGFHVHPHEIKIHRVSKLLTCVYVLREQIGRKVFPIHRLDAATSGVLIFALDSVTAGILQQIMQQRGFQKRYWAVTRGYVNPEGEINEALKTDTSEQPVPCQTFYQLIGTTSFPVPVGLRHNSARYSLVDVQPITGRFHQIRRHMNRIGHPIVGDTAHGDSHHNRFFRTVLQIGGLCLRHYQMSMQLPWLSEGLVIGAGKNPKWLQLFDMFQEKSAFSQNENSQFKTLI